MVYEYQCNKCEQKFYSVANIHITKTHLCECGYYPLGYSEKQIETLSPDEKKLYEKRLKDLDELSTLKWNSPLFDKKIVWYKHL